MKCPVVNCEKEMSYGRKTCEMHYMRQHRHKDFHRKKSHSTPINFEINDAGCFVVTSHVQGRNGYFATKKYGVRKSMHRHIYEECFGEIPENLMVCHTCDNKKCINPEHLELGTAKKNTNDAIVRGLRKSRKKVV